MSLKPQTGKPVPAETARVAKVAFPQGNVYRQIMCCASRRSWPSGHERKHVNRLLQR